MTDDTNAALMYSILPSIGECCKSDPDTARKLREIFVKVEKHAPGFSEDFIGALHKGLSRPQFPYDATLLSLSGQDLKEFKMIKTEWVKNVHSMITAKFVFFSLGYMNFSIFFTFSSKVHLR